MPHLDDGQIAEWIDSADGRTERRQDGRAEEHLRECAVCRERVEEAQVIAERARAILGAAAPAQRAVPPFEEVLHRAGRRRVEVGGTMWVRRLAWAATVVIAGGLGWFAHGELQRPVGPTAAPPQMLAQRADNEPAAGAELKSEAPVGAVGGVAPPAARLQAPAEQSEVRQETDRAAAPARTVVAAQEQAERQNEVLQDSAARADVAQPLAAAPSPSIGVSAKAAGAGMAQAPTWVPVSRADAERALGDPLLLVADLPVRSIELSASGAAVRSTQDLGNGAILELVQEVRPATDELGRAVAAEAAAEPAVTGARRARDVPALATETVTVRGIRLAARAPVSADSLRALLARIGR